MVKHQTVSVRWCADVEFEEQAADRGWDACLGGEGEQDIGAGIDEVNKKVWGQRRTKAFRLGRQEEKVGICGHAMLEERQASVFGCTIGDLKAAFCPIVLADRLGDRLRHWSNR